jgi:hypothetical protein
MKPNECPTCSYRNFPYSPACEKCGTKLEVAPQYAVPPDVSAARSDISTQVQQGQITKNPSTGDAVNMLVWIFAVLLIGSSLFSLESRMENASGAPQQAVAAAYTACTVIIYYCLARAISAIIRTAQGK